MKDLYSFDDSVEAAFETYEQVREAYKRIFTRIGVPFVVAEADSGNIGGSKSHEYHLVSQVGEDTLLTCSGCGYTANEELAVGKLTTTNQQCDETKENAVTALIKNSVRLNQTSVDATVVSFYEPNDTKEGIQGYAAVLTPPGRSANLLKVQTKLSKHLKKTQQLGQVSTIEMKILSEEVLKQIPSSTLVSQLHLFLDDSISNVATDSLSSKITVHPADHFRIAKEGDRCTSCDSELSSVKAIECGHTFYLGTKYSSALDCGYRKPNGEKVFAEMGCYGIGITRLLAAVAEARYDKRGIVWPRSLAPYKVCIIPTDDRKAEFKEMAEKVYDKLNKTFKGDIVIDDRRSGFGAKMKDAELIGYPFTVVVGQKSLTDESLVELHERVQYQESTKSEVCLDDLEKGFLVE
ncbi:class II aaRS and biotin synthetase [Rhizopus microsporus]|nr:class II aaRS and biotin synthetase [Rhizopus microsporus]